MDLDNVNLGDLSDAEIAGRMRRCNYEKFKTLVRMHLSFELDLNTDEFDLPCHEIVYEDKGKLKKWNRMSKKHKYHSSSGTIGCSATAKGSTSAGNSPTESLQTQIDAGFLLHMEELKEFLLMEKNLTQEGIFRKTGSASRQNELRQKIQNDQRLDLENVGYSVHDCATVFKGYLAELSEPLLTDAHYPAYLQIAPLCIGSALYMPVPLGVGASPSFTKPPNPDRIKRDQQLLNSMQLLLLLLPEESRQLLQHIIEILHAVAAQNCLNKMSAENLATMFAPHLICPRNLPPEALHYMAKKMSGIIAYMVIRGMEIFEVPPKLATDIRAYFLERKRKKTMSPEQTLDDSISDISTVNTVYTFVDREKTAAAHTANNTDTELAQLYAHIQSLPESSKKRRLIKQFNKQNGQGTPLQLVVMNRLKNSEATRAKSISDSIKKHIFHKGIMSRTPKRHAAAAIPSGSGIETPNFSNIKNPKLRVLFQSPTPATSCISVAGAANSMSNCTSFHTPYSIKTHPLQKSISSSSLLLNSSSSTSSHPQRNLNFAHSSSEEVESSSSCSSDGFSTQQKLNVASKCVSAPVSRQTSSDLGALTAYATTSTAASSITTSGIQHLNLLDPNCCTTPLKLISEAAKALMGVGGGGGDKKTVAWDDDQLLQIEEEVISQGHTLEQQAASDLKSRYKSEPNLSCMLKERSSEEPTETYENTPILKGGKSLTRKLMKGVSMGNLRLPFSTPETTKHLRSVSSSLKRRSSDETHLHFHAHGSRSSAATPLLEDLDDETFEDDSVDSESDTDEHDVGSQTRGRSAVNRNNSSSNELPGCSEVTGTADGYQHMLLQQSGVYRNLNLITSTPSLLLSRRSMSPITKSTQRMPKAMQESIMTPRSRKPVMVLTTTTLSSSDQNQTICQTDVSGFREQDEEGSLLRKVEQSLNPSEDADSLNNFSGIRRSQHEKTTTNKIAVTDDNALTHDFKEYLRGRSVLTASPVDSSFSSQPDDFGDSAQEVEDLDESQLSPSLLYCLDGNQPQGIDDEVNASDVHLRSHPTESQSLLSKNPFIMLNNARKRAATNDLEKISRMSNASATTSTSLADKENCENIEGYHLLSKKLLISEYPGETSF